jgi:NAD(P)-dependent dehydrogenase (short-subunit alcohol dehydrogenase family)
MSAARQERFRSACVVGSGGGIGGAVVRRLVENGFQPVLEMDLEGPIRIDLSNPGSVQRAFATAQSQLARLDALVVASGILDLHKLNDLTLERWNDILAVNLTGPFLCCQLARDWLNDGGRIVLMGSLAGRTGGVLTGTAYAVSKGGIESLTKSVAQELAPRRITVNCVAPGGVDTPMLASNSPEGLAAMKAATPLKRMAAPEEIAAAIGFLVSDDAAYITGSVMAVNGGLRMD